MASGSNAPFSGEFVDLENVPKLPRILKTEASNLIQIGMIGVTLLTYLLKPTTQFLEVHRLPLHQVVRMFQPQ